MQTLIELSNALNSSIVQLSDTSANEQMQHKFVTTNKKLINKFGFDIEYYDEDDLEHENTMKVFDVVSKQYITFDPLYFTGLCNKIVHTSSPNPEWFNESVSKLNQKNAEKYGGLKCNLNDLNASFSIANEDHTIKSVNEINMHEIASGMDNRVWFNIDDGVGLFGFSLNSFQVAMMIAEPSQSYAFRHEDRVLTLNIIEKERSDKHVTDAVHGYMTFSLDGAAFSEEKPDSDANTCFLPVTALNIKDDRSETVQFYLNQF